MRLEDLAAFEPTQHASAADPLPAGWYEVRLVEHDWRKTNSNTGHYLALFWEVVSTHSNEKNDPKDSHRGRRVREMLNLDNPRKETIEIAQEKLARIMNSTGVPKLVQGANSLLGQSCLIRVNVVPGDEQYPPKNDVKGYRPLETTQLPLPQAAQPSAPYNQEMPF